MFYDLTGRSHICQSEEPLVAQHQFKTGNNSSGTRKTHEAENVQAVEKAILQVDRCLRSSCWEERIPYLCLSLTRRVNKPDDPVFTPALIVEFGTDWIQLPPLDRQHDPIFCNALAYQSLFNRIRASL